MESLLIECWKLVLPTLCLLSNVHGGSRERGGRGGRQRPERDESLTGGKERDKKGFYEWTQSKVNVVWDYNGAERDARARFSR